LPVRLALTSLNAAFGPPLQTLPGRDRRDTLAPVS
jgi:hypothetical protein